MTTVGPPGLRPLAGLTAAVVVAHLLVLQQASMSLSPGDAPALHTPPLNTRMVTPPAPVAEPAPAPKPSPPPPRKPPAAPKARPNRDRLPALFLDRTWQNPSSNCHQQLPIQ